MIKVKLLGALSKYMPTINEEGYWVVDAENISINEVLLKTNIHEVNIKFSTLVNNIREELTYILHDGDTLTIMPLLAGG